jgi:Flp pilus assembly protein TadG
VAGPERGAATLELAVTIPTVLFLVLLVIQFALWQHAGHVVTAAAQEAVSSAQAEDGSGAVGERAGRALLAAAGSGLVDGQSVVVTRTGSSVRAVVRGRAVVVVPGFALPVTGVAEGPVERFVAVTER